MLEKAQIPQRQDGGDVFDPGLDNVGAKAENTMVEQ